MVAVPCEKTEFTVEMTWEINFFGPYLPSSENTKDLELEILVKQNSVSFSSDRCAAVYTS